MQCREELAGGTGYANNVMSRFNSKADRVLRSSLHQVSCLIPVGGLQVVQVPEHIQRQLGGSRRVQPPPCILLSLLLLLAALLVLLL